MAIAPGPTLETARLILRPTGAQDLDGWAELMGDAQAARPSRRTAPEALPIRLERFLT